MSKPLTTWPPLAPPRPPPRARGAAVGPLLPAPDLQHHRLLSVRRGHEQTAHELAALGPRHPHRPPPDAPAPPAERAPPAAAPRPPHRPPADATAPHDEREPPFLLPILYPGAEPAHRVHEVPDRTLPHPRPAVNRVNPLPERQRRRQETRHRSSIPHEQLYVTFLYYASLPNDVGFSGAPVD